MKPFFTPNIIEAGCDEAGRGCLAGPVFAAAVILPQGFDHPLINDSKQLCEKKRSELRTVIEEVAVAWSVAMVDNAEIDRINILNASIMAMHLAIDGLKVRPQHLLIDGNRFKPYPWTVHTCIVKGDSLYLPIAAASILAKTHRDQYMQQLHLSYPAYGWSINKGYPTKTHRGAIAQYGTTPHHRLTFRLLRSDTAQAKQAIPEP